MTVIKHQVSYLSTVMFVSWFMISFQATVYISEMSLAMKIPLSQKHPHGELERSHFWRKMNSWCLSRNLIPFSTLVNEVCSKRVRHPNILYFFFLYSSKKSVYVCVGGVKGVGINNKFIWKKWNYKRNFFLLLSVYLFILPFAIHLPIQNPF